MIGRFGDESDGRTTLDGDFERLIGEICRTGLTVTVAACDGGCTGAVTSEAAARTSGGAVDRVRMTVDDTFARLGRGER